MKKLFLIGLKDLKLAFRDKAAITFMLLAPFLLTLGLGLVSGGFSGGSASGIEQIPLLVVNQDEGELGAALVELLTSPDLSELLLATVMEDEVSARTAIDADQAAAAVIIPPGFTDSIIPPPGQTTAAVVVPIEVYKNPTRPVGSGVIQSIVDDFISRVETGRISVEVTLEQMLVSGLASPDGVQALVEDLTAQQADIQDRPAAITLSTSKAGEPPPTFNVMAYMAPGMALMFLMFTASNGGRSILAEQARGTLPRLLVSPTTGAQVMIGKVFGIFLTGVLQMLILVVASSLLFRIQWGNPLGVLVLILLAVFGATGWGMLITALARTPNQVSSIGTALMLTFGILGGSFFQTDFLPVWYQWLSRITPNAWGMDGFTILAMGGDITDLGGTLLGLAVMGILLAFVAILIFNRRPVGKK